MHLITGRGGEPHVTAENDAIRNAQIYGNSNFVIDFRDNLSASVINDNTVRISDGYGVMNGRFFEIEKNLFEDLTIENGTSGTKREDLICARYSIDSETHIESIALVVIKGEPSSSYVAPSYNEGSIFDGDSVVDFPLYAVKIDGTSIVETEQLFNIVEMGYADRVSTVENNVSDLTNTAIHIIAAEKVYVTLPAGESTELAIEYGEHVAWNYSRFGVFQQLQSTQLPSAIFNRNGNFWLSITNNTDSSVTVNGAVYIMELPSDFRIL